MSIKSINLTEGPIFKQLFKLAIPIIGTSLMQMAYNLTDMVWLGQLGSEAVAAVGGAGFFIWLGISLLLVTRVGAEVGVSQSIGSGDTDMAARFARHALFYSFVLSLFLSVVVIIAAPYLIGIFDFSSTFIVASAAGYLRIVAIGFMFSFVNPTFQGVYNGLGKSKLPFYYLFIGLVINMLLDPLLIFGVGFLPALGVNGAAYATLIAQFSVFSIFFFRFVIKKEVMDPEFLKLKLSKLITLKIFKLGMPVAVESSLFAVFALILARMITQWGDAPIAVQSIGAQIEALSWMTASGFATALGSFTGQNYGAGNWTRILKGYYSTLLIGVSLGVFITLAFVFAGHSIFSIFLDEKESLLLGTDYLKILAVSQIFMIVEIITRGAFNGLGKTIPPSIIGIVFTGIRVPSGWLLSAERFLGMYGIWWSISLSSVIKGLVSVAWFHVLFFQLTEVKGDSKNKVLMNLIPNRMRHTIFIRNNKIN